MNGEAYVAEDELILHLDVRALACLPCAICNKIVDVPVMVKGLYHAEPVYGIKNAVFDMTDLIRENVLLEVPRFAECNEGSCPERKNVDKYIKEPSKENDSEGYRPFSDLKLED